MLIFVQPTGKYFWCEKCEDQTEATCTPWRYIYLPIYLSPVRHEGIHICCVSIYLSINLLSIYVYLYTFICLSIYPSVFLISICWSRLPVRCEGICTIYLIYLSNYPLALTICTACRYTMYLTYLSLYLSYLSIDRINY